MKTYIGIDWGGRNNGPATVCLLKKMNDGNVKTTILELTLDTSAAQVEMIDKLIEQHDPEGVVADIGYGYAQCQMLQRSYGELVKSCFYSSNTDSFSYNVETRMLTVNRDAMMNEAIKLIGGPFNLEKMTQNGLHALNYAYIAYCTSAQSLTPEVVNV